MPAHPAAFSRSADEKQRRPSVESLEATLGVAYRKFSFQARTRSGEDTLFGSSEAAREATAQDGARWSKVMAPGPMEA